VFLELKQNRSGHNFKDDRDVEAVVTGWLVTQDRDCCQQETASFIPRYDKWIGCGEDCVEN